MAITRLSDAIEPAVYLDYQAVDNPETSAFFLSGVATRNAQLDALAEGPSKTVDMPFWRDLDPNEEPNYSNDDPDEDGAVGKVTAGEMRARKAFLNKAYADADLVAELIGSDPMQRIRNRFGTYWTRQWQRRTLAMLTGILADNVANDGGDMVEDIAIADGNAATDANLFSRSAFVNAAFTLGDMWQSTSAIAVHSVVMKRMVDNDDIEFIPDSKGALTIPTFLGRRVIVDDGMPVVAGATSGFVYTSILMGTGLVGYGEGTPQVPVEVKRDAEKANGGGVETIWERQTWLQHIFGMDFTAAGTISELSPTLANLRLAANWNRVVDRKSVPLAYLRTNG